MANWLQQLFGIITMYKIEEETRELEHERAVSLEIMCPSCRPSIDEDVVSVEAVDPECDSELENVCPVCMNRFDGREG